MKAVFFVAILLLLSGCNFDTAKSGSQSPNAAVVLPVTEYDIFNLTWGMKRDECYKVCDWGGKLVKKLKYPIMGSHIIRLDKGQLYVELLFNENDCLYRVNLRAFYSDIQFSTAKDFYFYLRSILGNKYKLSHQSDLYGYLHLSNSVLYEYFLKSKVSFVTFFESSTTEIHLSMCPWTIPNSFVNKVVLHLEYISKHVKNNSGIKRDLKREKDSVGF